MLNLLCYLVPGVIAVQLLTKVSGEMKTREYIVNILIFDFIILILNYLVLDLVFGYSDVAIDLNNFYPSFIVKYLAISVVWAFILPFIKVKLITRLNLRIEVEE